MSIINQTNISLLINNTITENLNNTFSFGIWFKNTIPNIINLIVLGCFLILPFLIFFSLGFILYRRYKNRIKCMFIYNDSSIRTTSIKPKDSDTIIFEDNNYNTPSTRKKIYKGFIVNMPFYMYNVGDCTPINIDNIQDVKDTKRLSNLYHTITETCVIEKITKAMGNNSALNLQTLLSFLTITALVLIGLKIFGFV